MQLIIPKHWIIGQYPRMRRFLSARFLFIMAMQMINTGVGWHIYDITGDPLALGWLGVSEVIPAISLALYAGHFIDINDKRTTLFRGMMLYLLAALSLVVATSLYFLIRTGNAQTVALVIYIIIFFTGIFRAFTGPVFAAILAQLVDRKDLPKAVTLSSTAWQSASVVGPVLGGVLITSIGMTSMMCLACVLLLLGVLTVSYLPRLPVQHKNPDQKTWSSVREGLSFVWRTKEVLSAITVDMFAVLFGGAVAMLPVFAKDILHVDADGMGLLKAAQGMGTVFILFAITRRPLKKNQGKIMLVNVALFGVMMIVFALSKNFWLSFAVLALSGVFDGISVVVRSTILQLYVPDEMRGRVSSVNSMFINSSNELGQMESGIAAKIMGVVPSVIFGGSITLLIVAFAWWKTPKLRKLEY